MSMNWQPESLHFCEAYCFAGLCHTEGDRGDERKQDVVEVMLDESAVIAELERLRELGTIQWRWCLCLKVSSAEAVGELAREWVAQVSVLRSL